MTMATTEQQMSLTVAPMGSSSHLNRPARQLVPAFLQKLYEMVNDPANQDLIRWSDTGDTFFVLDQERFASEVLGRWFKHNRFSSFVRQLNMYGFHKIPHLQQGVLRADSDTEFWNFEHPHFLRGQPDLLCLIQRKKHAATTGEDVHVAPAVAAAAARDAAGNAAVATLSANQLVDINSIVNGLQAIKRHQAAISADLNELKGSNQHLWQEAMTARERHKKHQDTINRILKFLAGVFGHGDNQMRKDEDAPHAVVARKPQRLLIADGRSEQKADANEAVEDEPRSSMESARSDFFASDTPSAPPSEPFTTPRFASVEPNVTDAPPPTATEPRPVPQEIHLTPIPPPSDTANTTPSAASTTPAPSQANNDSIVQAALTSVLNSPTQMQKLLVALASQSLSPEVFSSTAQSHHQQHLIAPTPYNNNPQQLAPNVDPAPGNIHPNVAPSPRSPSTFDYAGANALSPFTLSLLGGSSEPDPYALEQQDERLQKSYKSTAEINSDVDELQNNIQSLIQSLGIDPTSLDPIMPSSDAAAGIGGGGGGPPTSLPTSDADMFPHVNLGAGPDFDFDSFLMDMPRANDEDGDLDTLAERLDPSTVSDPTKIGSAASEQLHAFLDEVASQDGSDGSRGRSLHESRGFKTVGVGGGVGVGVSIGAGAPAAAGTRGRKRKSDVIVDGAGAYASPETQAAAAAPAPSSSTGNRSKRKR